MDFTERERFLRFLALGVAEDESLYAHDRRFHPDGYHGGRCLYRAHQAAGDPSDTLLAGSLRGTSSPRPRGGAAPSAPWECEYAEVVARYTNPDGSHKKGWLRAPNGKPTNLTKRQWVQVRTPSFKKWFGDWEKAPENASKVIDSNGEPMVCWHGGPDNSFTRFDKRRIHPKDGIRAFFFAPPKRRDSVAGRHGEGKERPFFLNIRTPLVLSPDDSPKGKKGDGIIRIYQDDEEWEIPYFNYRTDKEQTETMRKGDILEIQVFEPNQIKSADGNSGEFSPRKETVMDSQIDLKKIAQLAIAEDELANRGDEPPRSPSPATLDIFLEVLEQEGDEPRRAPYPKTRPVPPPAKSPAEDAAPDDDSPTQMASDLQKHDRRFHPQGYKEGDSCKYRETLAKGDKSDEALSAAETAESRGNLSSKKHAEYLRLMQKKHPELDAMAVLAEVGKIGDKKIQGDAFAWVLRGAVRLPEDLYKVEQARELATKAKVDPLSFSTPQACINDLLGKGHKVSLKPITVEELKKDPLFSDYQKLPAGVETFEVEDSREGQRRMREVIDTHWGKDANPWCLLARKEKESWERSNDREEYEKSEEWWRSLTPPEREEIADKIYKKDTSRDIIDDFVNCESIVDADGAEDYYYKNVAEPVDDLENAWDYWNHYNALPKRVAFKDGKLLAFMATDPLDEDSAFDDAAYGGGSKLAKMYPDEYEEYERWEETDEGQEEGANFFEWLQHNYPELTTDEALHDNVPEEWWDRSDAPHKGIPLGNMAVPGDKFGRWADMEVRDGKAVPVGKFQKGDDPYKEGYESWYDNGKKEAERKDGKLSEWYENGDIKRKTFDDMTVRFREDGTLSILNNHGTKPIREIIEVSFWDNGTPASIGIHYDHPASPTGLLSEYANLALRRDGTVSPDSTLSPFMPESEIRAKADALIAEAKRRFPNGGKSAATPAKDAAPSRSGEPPRSPFPEKAFQKWLEKQC